MNEFGLTIPILITEDEEVIAGHARLEASRRAGLKTVPVIVARLRSKAQIRAYRLADNRLAELGSWDEKLLRIEISEIVEIAAVPLEVTGWSTDKIDVILDGVEDDEEPSLDNLPPLPKELVSRRGDI